MANVTMMRMGQRKGIYAKDGKSHVGTKQYRVAPYTPPPKNKNGIVEYPRVLFCREINILYVLLYSVWGKWRLNSGKEKYKNGRWGKMGWGGIIKTAHTCFGVFLNREYGACTAYKRHLRVLPADEPIGAMLQVAIFLQTKHFIEGGNPPFGKLRSLLIEHLKKYDIQYIAVNKKALKSIYQTVGICIKEKNI